MAEDTHLRTFIIKCPKRPDLKEWELKASTNCIIFLMKMWKEQGNKYVVVREVVDKAS